MTEQTKAHPAQEPKPQAWMLITESGACGGIFRFRYDAEVQARVLFGRFSIVPLYSAPVAANDTSSGIVAKAEELRHEPEVVERGKWRAAFDKGAPEKVFVESDDFTHDVRLYVNGDFADEWQKLQYAQQIARMLNAFKLPTGEQEPVAWMYDWWGESEDIDGVPQGGEVCDWLTKDYDEAHSPTMGCHNIRPLYTAPPQREWQGLTDDERKEIFESMPGGMQGFLRTWGWLLFSKALEQKLKEKNVCS